jgi:hypothetical protein
MQPQRDGRRAGFSPMGHGNRCPRTSEAAPGRRTMPILIWHASAAVVARSAAYRLGTHHQNGRASLPLRGHEPKDVRKSRRPLHGSMVHAPARQRAISRRRVRSFRRAVATVRPDDDADRAQRLRPLVPSRRASRTICNLPMPIEGKQSASVRVQRPTVSVELSSVGRSLRQVRR